MANVWVPSVGRLSGTKQIVPVATHSTRKLLAIQQDPKIEISDK